MKGITLSVFGPTLVGLALCLTRVQGDPEPDPVLGIQGDGKECPEEMVSFELVTGSVFSSSADTMATLPGSIQLTDCLTSCRHNKSCKAINFETGLCILLGSSASLKPLSLTPSQFPVFTIYAEKRCLKGLSHRQCPASWAFERVIGYELRGYIRKKLSSPTKEHCLDSCLLEPDFECRSANYDNSTGECTLSHLDRHAIKTNLPRNRYFSPSSSSSTGSMDYFESNCVREPKGLCDFKPIKGKILKTVDSIYEDVKTPEACQQKCLDAPYRCFSYDFGDPANGKICRTSHLDAASLTHVEEPFLDIPDSVTYERIACYDVSISCKAREMVARVATSKLFSGKLYAKSKPNSCLNDVANSLDFEISMPYHDLVCDVKQTDQGKFTNDIIIQHHDSIVTTKDLGLSVNCYYDLSNRSITNNQGLEVDGDMDNREGAENVHSATVSAPDIQMRITDREGLEISTARVGDPLALRFEILEPNSPYQIFVRELVAVDGVDTSDIVLIDSIGCPTDINIMGFVSRVNGKEKVLEIPFDAFKFPTSNIVQFRALVTPCFPACEPVYCMAQALNGKTQEKNSFGKRKRSAEMTIPSAAEEEMVVIQSIKIMDSFGFQGKQQVDDDDNYFSYRGDTDSGLGPRIDTNPCFNMAGLTLSCLLFLLLQLLLVLVWAYLWYRKNKQRRAAACLPSNCSSSSDSTTASQRYDIFAIMKNRHD